MDRDLEELSLSSLEKTMSESFSHRYRSPMLRSDFDYRFKMSDLEPKSLKPVAKKEFDFTKTERILHGRAMDILEKKTKPLDDETDTKEPEYPSKTTEEYFEGWDSVVLEGNPGIKERIRQNIIEAEKKNNYKYKIDASRLGISVEELKRRLQEKVEKAVAKSDFFRATHIAVLEKVLNVDGRYKSQFETGVSNGNLDPITRSNAEKYMFGFDSNKEHRPIYGYFSDDEHGVINEEGTIPPPNRLSNYGPVTVKFNKECVIGKSTIAFQDTLYSHDEWPPTPSTKPHFTSFQYHGITNDIDFTNKLTRTCKADWGGRYTEAQFHNQLTIYDIEAIYISEKNKMSKDDIDRVRDIFRRFKESNPESTIELIEY